MPQEGLGYSGPRSAADGVDTDLPPAVGGRLVAPDDKTALLIIDCEFPDEITG